MDPSTPRAGAQTQGREGGQAVGSERSSKEVGGRTSGERGVEDGVGAGAGAGPERFGRAEVIGNWTLGMGGAGFVRLWSMERMEVVEVNGHLFIGSKEQARSRVRVLSLLVRFLSTFPLEIPGSVSFEGRDGEGAEESGKKGKPRRHLAQTSPSRSSILCVFLFFGFFAQTSGATIETRFPTARNPSPHDVFVQRACEKSLNMKRIVRRKETGNIFVGFGNLGRSG